MSAGAAGLAFMRVLADGGIDAAKPIKEGLSPQHVADLLAATQAQEVRVARMPGSRCHARLKGAALVSGVSMNMHCTC